MADSDYITTFEQARSELEAIEAKLARICGIKGLSAPRLRRKLVELIRSGELVENELVADWHDAYSWYLSWKREQGRAGARSEESPPPYAETAKANAEAASAAFALL